MADLAHARAAKARLRSSLASAEGVCGIGLAPVADGYAVRVDVRRAADRRDLPTAVDGVPVSVRVVGAITPQEA